MNKLDGMVHGYRIQLLPIRIQMVRYGLITVIHLKKNYYLKEVLYYKEILLMELYHH